MITGLQSTDTRMRNIAISAGTRRVVAILMVAACTAALAACKQPTQAPIIPPTELAAIDNPPHEYPENLA